TSTIAQWSRKVYEYANSEENVKSELAYWEAQPWEESNRLYNAEGFAKNTSDDESQYGADICYEHSICSNACEYLLSDEFQSNTISIATVFVHAFSQAISSLTQSKVTHFEYFATGREQYVRGVDVSRTIGHFVESTQIFITQSESDDRIEQLRECHAKMQELPALGLGFNAIKHMCKDTSAGDKLKSCRTAEFLINYMPPGQNLTDKDRPSDIPAGFVDMAKENPGRTSSPNPAKIIMAAY